MIDYAELAGKAMSEITEYASRPEKAYLSVSTAVGTEDFSDGDVLITIGPNPGVDGEGWTGIALTPSQARHFAELVLDAARS